MRTPRDKLSAAYMEARRETRFHAKSFYFSSFALPAEKRRNAYAVYALCRFFDDRVDEAETSEAQEQAVDDIKELLDRIYHSGKLTPNLPWLPATRKTIEVCDVPKAYFLDLLEGVALDRGTVRLMDWPELDRYCYLVAGVVGLIMTRVFGLEDRRYEKEARDLGCAMQLTNILRDVAEDLEKDRIYLPEEELQRFGMSHASLLSGNPGSGWQSFMEFQIDRARTFYHSSEDGIRHLPDDGSRRTVWVMRDVYAGILDEIQRADHDVFSRRCFVSFPRKCGLVFRRLLLNWSGAIK